MLKNLREERNDEGFTLIELMVVVLIISILIAIAIPTFLGAREGAQDRGAQSNLRNSLTAAKTLFANEGNYSTADAAGLLAVEPSLVFADDTDVKAAIGTVSVTLSTTTTADDTITLSAMSESGTCYFLEDAGSGTTYAAVVDAADCDSSDTSAATFAGGGW